MSPSNAETKSEHKRENAFEATEDKYRLLFNSIDEGFCIIEVVFDTNSKPIDYRFLEVNSIFEEQTGLHNAVGKLMRSMEPTHEEHWFRIYGGVALTGISTRFMNEAKALNRWYDVYAFPVGKVRPYQVGILFKDITERKKAEEALKEKEQIYHSLFENTQDGFQFFKPIYDKNGDPSDLLLLGVNKAYEKQTSLKETDVVGKRVREFLPNIEYYWILTYGNVAKTGQSTHIENYNKATNRWYDVFAFPYGQGNVGALFRDVTERKKAEESLKESQELYRTLFEKTEYGFQITQLIYDKGGDPVDLRYLKVNDAFFKQTGLKPTIVEGKTAKELFPNLESYWFETYDKVLKNGKPTYFTNYNRDTERWYDAYLFPYEKNTVGGLFRNITDRKNVELAPKNSEEWFRSLVESTSDIIWQVDDNAVYTYISPKVRDVLGYEPKEVIGKTPFDLIDKKDEGKILNAFLEIANKKEPFYGLENWNVHKNGSRVLLETSGVPILDEKGKLSGYRGIDRDITERKKLQEELENYTKNLEKTVEERTRQLQEKERLAAIGATAGMVGHDIRNPLQAMISDIYLMKEVVYASEFKNKEELTESLVSLEENINYINKIVQDLQDYARPIQPEYSTADLSNIIVRIFETVRVQESIKLSIKIKDLEKLNTDPMLLQRALSNLITNAIQAMPEGGVLEITGHPEENKVIISVSDTGVGIPDEIKPKLFTPMMTTKSKGQGFGLAVSKRLIEAMKGHIAFESEKGKGTKFIIDLPASL